MSFTLHVQVQRMKSLKAYSGEATVQYGQVGDGDILYTPAAWFFYEQVAGSDCVGVRGAFLSPFDMKRLDSLGRYLSTIDKPNDILTRALDTIEQAE